eukprot:728369-Hanusia_phi.AAC.7
MSGRNLARYHFEGVEESPLRLERETATSLPGGGIACGRGAENLGELRSSLVADASRQDSEALRAPEPMSDLLPRSPR